MVPAEHTFEGLRQGSPEGGPWSPRQETALAQGLYQGLPSRSPEASSGASTGGLSSESALGVP